MGTIALETKTSVYTWALMTNHAHIFLRSGPSGLSLYMRRFLSSYAVSYNRRHCRHGHLFQNHYKSIVCEEDSYFKELVRYIHLNPLRAKLVDNLAKLDRYRYCGHSVLMGRVKNDWQDRDYVLKGSHKNKLAILSVEAPVWQGAKVQEYQAYSELSQRSHAGCISA